MGCQWIQVASVAAILDPKQIVHWVKVVVDLKDDA